MTPSRGRIPLWSLLALAAGSVVVVQAGRPLDDPDVWWHVRAGDSILDAHRLPSHESWVWTAAGRRWVPTSWLSDVTLALAHRAGGWQGVRLLTVAVAALFATALARHLRRQAAPLAAAVSYSLVAVVTAGYLRERPQAASLCLVVLLSAWCEQLRRGRPPAWWLVAGITWFWACVHGMWVLVPACLLLSGASGGREAARRCAPAVAAAALAAALTPIGPRLLVQPFVVAHRARDIAEWQPVHLWSWQALFLCSLAALLVGVPRQDRLFAVGVLAFALLAERDVAPAAIMLGPLIARRLDTLLPRTGADAPALAGRAVVVGAACLVTSVVLFSPSVSRTVPMALVTQLDEDKGAHVLVDYDIGGLVTGQARNVSAAVDGRTDVYDPKWLSTYLRMTVLEGDWPSVLAGLRPSRALVQRHGGLARALVDAGWRIDGTEAHWVLLSPPPDASGGLR